MMTEHSTSIEHSSTHQWVGRWSLRSFLALGVVILMFLPTAMDPTTAQEGPSPSDIRDVVDGREPFPMVGEIDLRGEDGAVLDDAPELLGADPGLNLVLARDGAALILVDTRTLEQVGYVELPFAPSNWFIDTVNHRLFATGGILTQPSRPTFGTANIVVVDLTGEQPLVHRQLEFDPALDMFAGPQVRARLAYDPGRDRLYFATETAAQDPDPTTVLHGLNVSEVMDSEAGGAVAPVWSMRLDSCGKVVTSRGGAMVYSERADLVAVACEGVSPPGGSATAWLGAMNAVVRVALHDAEDPSDTSPFEVDAVSFPGNISSGFAVGDPANDLAYVTTSAAGDQKLFVLDLLRGAWTGALSLHTINTTRTTSDPATGRIYQFDSDRGLLQVSEGGRVRVPNGITYDIGIAKAEKERAVVADPVTKRLFLRNVPLCLQEQTRSEVVDCPDEKTEDTPPHWRVFEDRLPDAPPPSQENWDERTQDLDPASEDASSQHSGSAQAFGATYTLVGGTRGTRLAGTQHTGAFIQNLPLGAGPRHFYLGRARRAGLSGSSFFGAQTAANATGLDVDSQTRNDYEQSGRTWPGDVPDQFRAEPTACTDFGGSATEESAAGSAVLCDSEQQLAQAAGLHTQPGESSIIQVGYGEANSEVTVDDQMGVISTADATARDITVGLPTDGGITPVIRVGEVQTTAQAVAHGQPGTAATSLEREIRQVVVGPPGDEVYECGFGDEPCDPYELVRTINELVPPRVRAYLPTQDTSLDDNADFRSSDDAVSNGTPGGAKSTVQKDPYEARSDEIIHSIGDDEVAGLVIVVYDDHDQPSRHVLHLAGVALDANYFIQGKPTWEPWPGPGSGDLGGGDGDLTGHLPGGGTDIGPAGSRIVTPPAPTSFKVPQDDLPTDGMTGEQMPDAPQQDIPFAVDTGTDSDAGGTSQGEPPALGTISEPGSDGTDQPAPEVAPPADGGISDSAQATGQGGPAGLLLTRQRLGQSAPLAALWLLGAAPFYLAVRRRQLTNTSHRR